MPTPKIDRKEKKLVAIVSAVLGVLMAIVSLVAYFILHFQGLPFDWDQLLVLALMVAVFPPAVVEYLDLRWERGIDKNIPQASSRNRGIGEDRSHASKSN